MADDGLADDGLADDGLADEALADEARFIGLEVEVNGIPEEVWRAVATGPGISSWYVPHVVEEREGGSATASFGPGPEMQIPGRVAAWEPPRRVVFDGGEGAGGLAFEWLIEARTGGTCIVRLVNTGFGSGEEWDAQYDGLSNGWLLFLLNLKLHLGHFRGETATAMLPTAMWAGDREHVQDKLTRELGISPTPAIGDRVHTIGSAPRLAGSVLNRPGQARPVVFLTDQLGLEVARFLGGSLGGDQQISAAIAEGRLDLVIFFWDPLEPNRTTST